MIFFKRPGRRSLICRSLPGIAVASWLHCRLLGPFEG